MKLKYVSIALGLPVIVTLSVPVLCSLLAIVFSKRVTTEPAVGPSFSPNAGDSARGDSENPYSPSGR